MASNQAMLLSSPSGLALETCKGGKRARWSMNGIQGREMLGFRASQLTEITKQVSKKRIKFLEAHGTRRYSEWQSRCNSQELSAIANDLNHTEGPAIHGKARNSSQILAADEHAHTLGLQVGHSDGLWTTAAKKLDAFYRFIRPYAQSSIAVSTISVSFLAVERMSDLSPVFFMGMLKALLLTVLITIYTVGINQIFDVEIDKINKPSLPLASGDFSMAEGILITVAFAAMAIFMGLKSGSPPLLCFVLASFFLSSAYSVDLPLLRWKEDPILSPLFGICSLGILRHIPFFVHIQKYVLGRPVALSKSIVFATAFLSLFATVITIFKDIPDLEGDKRAGIQNLCVRLGIERAFWLGINILLVEYGLAMLVGATSANTYSGLITVLGHGLLASILWIRARSVDIHSTTSTQSFHIFIWQLFTAEYLLLPFVR